MTNCKNCGAPIEPFKSKCEHCGTYQRDWANEVNRTLDVEAFDMAIKALEQEPRKGH